MKKILLELRYERENEIISAGDIKSHSNRINLLVGYKFQLNRHSVSPNTFFQKEQKRLKSRKNLKKRPKRSNNLVGLKKKCIFAPPKTG